MEILYTPPNRDRYIPLSQHQSATPSSFYSGPPVLHHASPFTTLLIQSSDIKKAPALRSLVPHHEPQSNGFSHSETDESLERAEDEEIEIHPVDVWVTSDKLLLWHSFPGSGVSIPYPSITLHAVQPSPEPSVILQILCGAGLQFDDHDPEGTVSLTIVPSSRREPPRRVEQQQQPSTPSSASPSQGPAEDTMALNSVRELFDALSACADLHPDPASNSDIDIDIDDEDEGNYPTGNLDTEDYTQIDGLPPPMPGSGGWITAENVGEFFDDEGNFRGGGRLGEGAGSVRGREEDSEEAGDDGNGADGEGEETKWRRTE